MTQQTNIRQLERCVIMREPRLDQAVACALLFEERGWDLDELPKRVLFEDLCSPLELETFGDINVRGLYSRGNSAFELMANELGVAEKHAGLIAALKHEHASRMWRRGFRFKMPVMNDGVLERPVVSLSYMWAAPYLYGVIADRYNVLRSLAEVGQRMLAYWGNTAATDAERKARDFYSRFPIFDSVSNVPVHVGGCAKMDFLSGRDLSVIEAWVDRELARLSTIWSSFEDARRRLTQEAPKVHVVEGRKHQLRVCYLRAQTHFDVPALFQACEADIVIAHSPTAGCTGVFTRHDLDLHAGMKALQAALEKREPGAWALADNPEGETPRVLNGTLGRKALVHSSMGSSAEAMLALLRDVAAGRT